MTDLALVASVVAVAAIIQGLSGLGFSLIAAPALSQIIPGTPAIGFVNLLGLIQNIWQMWSAPGTVKWVILRRLGPGLVIGFVVGALPLMLVDSDLRPLIVALASLGSLGSFLWWKPPASSADSALSAGAFGGAANTYAGVGAPPLEAYLLRHDWERDDFRRTLQLAVGILNLASIPLLGLPQMSIGEFLGAVALLPIGIVIGLLLRKVIPGPVAAKACQYLVLVVVGICLVRSVIVLSA